MRSRPLVLACLIGLLAASPALAKPAKQVTKPVGWGPRTSKAAAKLVTRNGWEARPGNRAENRRVPGRKLLRKWRRRSEMPYAKHVDGRFRGTTDEIIQWASFKWGIDTDLMRAVATVESWWDMDTRGDEGDSFGLYQVRRPYHCWGDCRIAGEFTAFNADYYGAIVRSYFDGTQTWLNTVTGNGRPYEAGDIDGSMGAWYSGRWWSTERSIQPYLDAIYENLAGRVWEQPFFVGR